MRFVCIESAKNVIFKDYRILRRVRSYAECESVTYCGEKASSTLPE